MLKPLSLERAIQEYPFVPQAIIGMDVSKLAGRVGLKVEDGIDDFDNYQGAAAWLDEYVIAIMHYSGHPDNTATVYLPFEVDDVKLIANIVLKVQNEFKLSSKDILWQRGDNSNLMKNVAG
jgi:hypothetical protein